MDREPSRPTSESILRVREHPILGPTPDAARVTLYVDGEPVSAIQGEPIAAALIAAGRLTFRYSHKRRQPRGLFCALGRCTDCLMTVDGRPNVRTCVTPAQDGMRVETQDGLGRWPGRGGD